MIQKPFHVSSLCVLSLSLLKLSINTKFRSVARAHTPFMESLWDSLIECQALFEILI